jgi:hypothetical protein
MSRQRSQFTFFLILLLATALTTTRTRRAAAARTSVLVNTAPGWEPPSGPQPARTGPLVPVARRTARSDDHSPTEALT